MTSGYTVDPDAVRGVLGKFAAPADTLEDAKKALVSALQSAGECWGNDEAGQSFAKDYVPAVEPTEKFFTELAKGIRDLQTGVKEAMDAYDERDAELREAVPGQELT